MWPKKHLKVSSTFHYTSRSVSLTVGSSCGNHATAGYNSLSAVVKISDHNNRGRLDRPRARINPNLVS